MKDKQIKRYTPEGLADALGFPEGTRVIGFRCVDYNSEWEIVATYEGAKGDTIPQFPPVYYELGPYVRAMQDYARDARAAYSEGKEFPIKPIYEPISIKELCVELEKAREAA